jgi:hypothetical protein
LDMCYFVSSQHNCGHLHERFARCFLAQRDGYCACNTQSFPIWQHPDPFPCPQCRADRKAETQDLMEHKGGRKASNVTSVKAETVQQEYSNAAFPRLQALRQNIQPQPQLGQQVEGEYANINAQLRTLADKALHLPPTPTPDPAVQAEQPWVPPSRRQISIVGQLGSSPPPPPQTYGTTPSQSPEMLSVEDSSWPDSMRPPAYPDQTPSASPQLAWLLREA